jgi:hypothetical protein
MMVLIFIVLNLVSWGGVSTGPHLYLDLAFGWLKLHRYGDRWSVEHFDFRMLIVAVLISVLLTWAFSKASRHRMA